MHTFAPMLLSPASKLPPHGYAFEFKWDGFRALVGLNRGRLSIHSRTLRDMTADFPEIEALAAQARKHRLVLDGELVCLGDDGRPCFERIQQKLRRGHRAPHAAAFMAFDILQQGGRDLTACPYSERRMRLDDLGLRGSHWQTPAFSENGAAMLKISRQHALEGIVAKRMNSAYRPGQRGRDWLKIKNFKESAFLICGWLPADQKREHGQSLILGHQDNDGALHYAGTVEYGFSHGTVRSIKKALAGQVVTVPPFGARFKLNGATYCEPLLSTLIRYLEWTSSGTLRHASFRSLLC
ncbi:MAG TPA: non-homologous end-joining DNA ligase [Planctomycetota bacterium]|nr:non-homologous end-joining DNA ligase [Planctomycetota bacterium]